MTCESAWRPVVQDKHWTCTGEGLAIVTTAKLNDAELPVVCPVDRLHEVHAGPLGSRSIDAVFAGGDHLHLVLDKPVTCEE